jgi:hypothetical protein
MAESTTSLTGWRYGMHPRATEMRIRALGRVRIELGEALRLEMVAADGDEADTVHLQYYIATELGTWALWLSCRQEELADREATLRELKPPFAEEQQP